MITRRSWLLGCMCLGLAGCGGGSRDAGPPSISYGAEPCARCGMLISDERHAAALVASDGTSLLFDDTGELIITVQEEGLAGRQVWVHAYDSRAWLDGFSARYVIDPNRNTPMGTGVIAFASDSDASSWSAGSTSTVLSWTELLQTWHPS